MRSEIELIEKRIRERFVKAFVTYHLLEDDDYVLVGLSGGKDSLCLLEMLAKRARIDKPRFKVEAAHIRMENIHYETDTTYLQQFCDSLGVPMHIITTSFETTPAAENSSLFTINSSLKEKPPCFLCSWYRRKQMFNMAQQLGCNKIALGHHQDDLLHTCLMNQFYQGRFDTMPALLKMKKMPLSIIRPLCMVEEKDIRRFAELRGYKKLLKLCPYEHDTHRTDMQQLFEHIQQMNPEARHSLWNALVRAGKLVEDY